MKFRLTLLGVILISLLVSLSGFTEASEMKAAPPPVEPAAVIDNAAEANCEVRSVWLNARAFNQDSTRIETLQKIKKANLNTIFAIAPPVGSNKGWSSATNFSKIVNEASSMGLSVHAWVINRERPLSGQADFTNTTEQNAQADWVIQMLKTYPKLDGVHFDYIRYDKYEVATTTGPYAHLPRVDATKTAGVSNTVQKAFLKIKSTFPNKKLSAAVKLISGSGRLSGGPYPADGPPYFWERNLPFQRENQQDVLSWVRGGYIDGVSPMNYPMSDTYWNFETQQWKQNVGTNFNKVYMGLGWLSEPDNPNYGFDIPGTLRKINYARSLGIKGFAIFQLGAANANEQDWKLVEALSTASTANNFDAPFKSAIPSCLASTTSPNLPSTPTPTQTPTATPTSILTATATVTVTQPPTSTAMPTSTDTAEPLPTETPDPTITSEPLPNISALTFEGPATVAPGQTFSVSVVARGITGSGLYGVQFDVNFDPALISVSNLQVNPELPFVLLNNADNAAGKIRLVAARQGNVPGLTGNVTLLTFSATAANTPGSATFTLANYKIGNAQALAMEITPQKYTLSIVGDATPEPTGTATFEPTQTPSPEPTQTLEPEPTETAIPEPTQTPEPTGTATFEPTQTPEPEPTQTPEPEPTQTPIPEPTVVPTSATVVGQIILTGRTNNDWSGASATFDDSQQSATTDAGGNFSIANVTTGAHSSLTADAPGYLPAVCTAPTIVAPQTTLANVTLLSGDVNDDGQVNITDATAIGVVFGNTGAGLPADLNRDGQVDILDLILVTINFGQGQQVWSCVQ